jgi:hypothetical protein
MPSRPATETPTRPPVTPLTTPPAAVFDTGDDERRFRFEARGEFSKRFGFNVAAPEDVGDITMQALDLDDTGQAIGDDESFVQPIDRSLELSITETFGEPTQGDVEEMNDFEAVQQDIKDFSQ